MAFTACKQHQPPQSIINILKGFPGSVFYTNVSIKYNNVAEPLKSHSVIKMDQLCMRHFVTFVYMQQVPRVVLSESWNLMKELFLNVVTLMYASQNF